MVCVDGDDDILLLLLLLLSRLRHEATQVVVCDRGESHGVIGRTCNFVVGIWLILPCREKVRVERSIKMGAWDSENKQETDGAGMTGTLG